MKKIACVLSQSRGLVAAFTVVILSASARSLPTDQNVINPAPTLRQGYGQNVIESTVGSARRVDPVPKGCPGGIVGWWSGEEDASDVSGNGNNGILSNGAVSGGPGQVGKGFVFNGNSNVQIANTPILNPTSAITLEAWIRPTGGSGQHRDIIGKDGESSQRQYLMTVSDINRVRGHVTASGNPFLWIDGATNVPLNTWAHAVTTYDGTTLKVYMIGVLDGSRAISGAIVSTAQPLRIGGGAPAGANQWYFPGSIDEPTIYNRALTEDEVKALYNAKTGGKCLPVVFIPGIGGSHLVDGDLDAGGTPSGTHLWITLNPFTDWLRLGLPGSTKIVATDALRSPGLFNVYGTLLNLLTSSGYREYRVDNRPARRTTGGCDYMAQDNADPYLRPNLFVFAYDWRKPNEDNAGRLKDYLGCIDKFWKGRKVDIVAHSMGGLVARRYVTDNAGDKKVDKLLTIGSPWLGAPKFLYVLETGDFLYNVRSSQIKQILPSFPGAHQLLPSQAYETLGGPPIFEKKGWNYDGDNATTGSFNYTQVKTFLDRRYALTKPGTTGDNFHSQPQDDWRSDGTDVKYFHFYGVRPTSDTIESVVATDRVNCLNPEIIECYGPQGVLDVKRTAGDGTVPELSASRCSGSNNLNAESAQLFKISGSWNHNTLTESPEVQDKIKKLLGSSMVPSVPCSSLRPESESLSPSYYVSVVGGASIEVTDTHGNSTAPLGGDVRGSVPDVETSFMGDNAESIVIPVSATEEYSIRFQSTGAPLAIDINKGADDDAPVQAIRYLDLTLPNGVRGELKFSSAQDPETLRYDGDGNGSFETVVNPTHFVNGPAAGDVAEPVLSIAEGPQQAAVSQVTITAVDAGSGVHDVNYSTDGTHFQPYIGPLSLNAAQTPVLHAFATDNVGNRTPRLSHPLQGAAAISGTVGYGTTPTGQAPKLVPGVVLTASGIAPVNATTNPAGAYVLSGLGAGAYTVTPTKLADVNGSISGLDAARVAQHVAGLTVLTPSQQVAGDATNNGGLSGLDAARIAQTAAGITNNGIAGQWKFLPASRSYASVPNSLTGENYEAILVGDVTGNWTPSAQGGARAGDDSGAETEIVVGSGSGLSRRQSFGSGGPSSSGVVAIGLPGGSAVAVGVGSRVTIPVSIGDTTGKGIVAYDFTVEYDPDVMRPAAGAIDTARTLSEGWVVLHNKAELGRVKVTAFSTREIAGKGVLLNLRFEALDWTGRSAGLKLGALQLNEGQVASSTSGPAPLIDKLLWLSSPSAFDHPVIDWFCAGPHRIGS
jgi:pimeloyl-ACP methyl ester carboxylesterase